MLGIRSEPDKNKIDTLPYQSRHSGLKGAVKIFIRGHLDKMWVPLPLAILSQKPQKGTKKPQNPKEVSNYTKLEIPELTALTEFSSQRVYSEC